MIVDGPSEVVGLNVVEAGLSDDGQDDGEEMGGEQVPVGLGKCGLAHFGVIWPGSRRNAHGFLPSFSTGSHRSSLPGKALARLAIGGRWDCMRPYSPSQNCWSRN